MEQRKEKEIKTVDTNIKFEISETSHTPVGFVAKKKGVWMGVTKDDLSSKLIVVVDKKLMPLIEPGVVYKCHLIPMKSGKGYVTTKATLMQYEAHVEGIMLPGRFTVKVKYGNRFIEYDPISKNPMKNDLAIVIEQIRECPQIRNNESVCKEFNECVTEMQSRYQNLQYGNMG